MAIQRQSLSIDLESLFPGDTVTIGNSSIIIRPLTLEQLSIMSKKVKALGSPLTEAGITWDNYNTPENLVKIVSVILENVPDLLEEAANVQLKDLKALPLDLLLIIVDKIIEVNLRSKEVLEKNFKSLTKNFLPEEVLMKELQKNQKKTKK